MLQLTDVRFRYGKNVAVDGLSLEIAPGEVFGLLGPNGAGKSTTVALAVGLLEPDEGQVTVAGEGSPLAPGTRAKIGVAPQSLALYEDLSGDENLRFFGALHPLAESRQLGHRIVRLEAPWGKLTSCFAGRKPSSTPVTAPCPGRGPCRSQRPRPRPRGTGLSAGVSARRPS